MLTEPERETEYTLVRFVDSELHVATFTRFSDDSGLIRHGGHVIKFEFNWPALHDYWQSMRDVGWRTHEEAIADGDLPGDVTPSCDCPTYAEQILEHIDAGMPTDELNRRIKEEGQPVLDQHERILRGG